MSSVYDPVYVLIAAAYLHDAGMVASDREKEEILKSDSWKAWTSGTAGGAKRWAEVQAFREGDEPSDKAVRDFRNRLQSSEVFAQKLKNIIVSQKSDKLDGEDAVSYEIDCVFKPEL